MKDVNLLTSNGVNVDQSLELFGDMDTYNDTLEEFIRSFNIKRLIVSLLYLSKGKNISESCFLSTCMC